MNYYEYIDDYKNGTLNGEPLRLFEVALKTDTVLQAAVDNYDTAKAISEGLLELDVMATLDRLKAGDEGGKVVAMPKRRFSIGKWLAVACVVAVCFVGWQYWGDNQSINKELLAGVYERPRSGHTVRSIDTLSLSLFEKGQYFLEGGLFSKSVNVWNIFIDRTTNQDSLSIAYYWLGSAYWEKGDLEKAKVVWTKSREGKALVYLKLLDEE